MSAVSRTPRLLDHLVLPVTDLATARERYAQLGFTVAADALHPFGTENACVFLADKTYLEPLGIAKREECEAAALAGNVFVARDQAYRFRRGHDGFSAVVLSSDDAAADHARFAQSGYFGRQDAGIFPPDDAAGRHRRQPAVFALPSPPICVRRISSFSHVSA